MKEMTSKLQVNEKKWRKTMNEREWAEREERRAVSVLEMMGDGGE